MKIEYDVEGTDVECLEIRSNVFSTTYPDCLDPSKKELNLTMAENTGPKIITITFRRYIYKLNYVEWNSKKAQMANVIFDNYLFIYLFY